jgi:hypothetical protein
MTGPGDNFVYGTASVFIASLVGNTLTTATGDTGIPTSNKIWMQGTSLEPKNTPPTVILLGSTLSSNYGSNWAAEVRMVAFSTIPNVTYTISYYSK